MQALTDKQVKAKFRPKFVKEYKKFYPVQALHSLGFERRECMKCQREFWSTDAERQACGEPACEGGFGFIGKTPAKKKLNYIEAWEEFAREFKKMGYLAVPRKPVVARWRNDVYWTGASVYGFQPYVVSGEIEPPSNAVIIPQLSLRFNDVDNVGITGSHYSCFDMLGQLRFEKKGDYAPGDYLKDYLSWLEKGMGIPRNALVLHEDSWAGGGTFGPSMEFFSAGLELGNQVYMQYSANADGGYRELDIKVLDMGQGHERIPWFTHGKSTSYETTFPDVVHYLRKVSDLRADEELLQKFLPYSAYLNVDEVENIARTWGFVAGKIGISVEELRARLMPMRDLYAIAEHSRAVLAALNDGAMFSNTGGGYNIRTLARRMFSLAEERRWDVDYSKLLELHAHFLRNLYPELEENLKDVNEMLAYELQKHGQTRFKSKQVIEGLIARKEKITPAKLAELYDSQGITPELLQGYAKGTELEVSVPDNFFALVAERHAEKKEGAGESDSEDKNKKTKKPEIAGKVLEGLPETKRMYYEDASLLEFDANVLYAQGNVVVLDRSAFYPTSGGQEHDTGEIMGERVIDVVAQGEMVLHILQNGKTKIKTKQRVKCVVDAARRRQLTQHHDGTHVLNYACREVLGAHCWQHGSYVGLDKARFDVTHYRPIDDAEAKKIEEVCSRIIKERLPIKHEFLARNLAEEKYGMRIYQGGYVPGKVLRILSIADLDIEACGGTHAKNTAEIGQFRILNTAKIQDGVIRITFVCGKAAEKSGSEAEGLLAETAAILGIEPAAVPSACENLFAAWKRARKLVKGKNTGALRALALPTPEKRHGLGTAELLQAAALAFSTQPEHVPKTAKRFLGDLRKWKAG
ncbi:MAG: alanine--tRNA ligase [Candidatus Diapherotrites archaeon]